VSRELAGPPYDPELPILAELEQALHARAEEAIATAAAAAAARASAAGEPRHRAVGGPAPTPPLPVGRRTASASYRGRRAAGAGRAGQDAAAVRGTTGDGARVAAADGAAGDGDAPGVGAPGRGRDDGAPHRLPGADSPARPRRRRGAALRRRGGVVVRRSAVLVSLSLLVGATAVATRSIVASGGGTGDPSLRTTRAVQLGAGDADGERWTLSAARRGGDLCHGFLAGGAVATRCEEPPKPARIVVDGLASGQVRYVVGLTGGRVETVVVKRGQTRRAVSTRALRPTTAARRARLPRDLRWFVVALPPTAPTDTPLPATVVGHDRAGRALGRAVVSCARGAGERGCERTQR